MKVRYSTENTTEIKSPSEGIARDTLISLFADEMRRKLDRKSGQGYSGWDDPKWDISEIKNRLIEHVKKGDPVDVANFAAFWWNRIR